MKSIETLSYCEAIKQFLKKQTEGFVHSKFENSFNIKLNDRLVNISADSKIYSPFGIQLSERSLEELLTSIDLNDLVIYSHTTKSISFPKSSISVTFNEQSYRTSTTGRLFQRDVLYNNLKEIVNYLDENQIDNGFDVNVSKFIEVTFLKRDPAYLQNNEYLMMVRRLKTELISDKLDIDVFRYFVGRGIGLTTSGDDFLVGILAAANIFQNDKINLSEINACISSLLDNTTDISKEYLYYAVNQNFSKSTIWLCERMRNPDRLQLIQTVEDVLDNSQTSGADTILGIIAVTLIL